MVQKHVLLSKAQDLLVCEMADTAKSSTPSPCIQAQLQIRDLKPQRMNVTNSLSAWQQSRIRLHTAQDYVLFRANRASKATVQAYTHLIYPVDVY